MHAHTGTIIRSYHPQNWRAIRFVVIGTALLLIALLEAIFAERNTLWLIAATLFGAPIAWFVLRRAWPLLRTMERIDLFSPLIAFPIAYVLWFGLASMNLLGDASPLPYSYFALGLVCYLSGAVFVWQRWRANHVLRLRYGDDWDSGKVSMVLWLFGVLALGSYAFLVWRMGIPALSPDANEQRLKLLNYGPEQAVFFSSTWTIFVFLAIRVRQRGGASAKRLVDLICLGTISFMLLSLGSRGYLFVPFLTAVVACYYVGPRIKVRTVALIAVLTFLGVSLYGYTRDTLFNQGYLAVDRAESLDQWLSPFVYAFVYVRQPVQTFRNVTEVIPREIPFQHGMLTFGAIATLFPGHHEMSDMFFKRILGDEFVGFGEPATLLGPFYGDFGVPGIAIGMMLFGWGFSRLYWWMRSRPTPFRLAVYGWAAQTALFSLFGALIPYITTLWIPFLWSLMNMAVKRWDSLPGQAIPARPRG